VLDHRLIGAADAEPLGGKAVERGLEFPPLLPPREGGGSIARGIQRDLR